MFLSEGNNFIGGINWVSSSSYKRRTDLGGNLAGRDFISEFADSSRRRSDPDQTSFNDAFCKASIFGEESITRVNCICTRCLGNFKDLALIKVCLGGRKTIECVGLISCRNVERIAILI